MSTLLRWLSQHGLTVAFLNVWAAQLGLPLPAYPALIVMGALTVDGRLSAAALLVVSIAGCLAADLAWFAAGRRYGNRVLRGVCRISLSPDTCVRQTQTLFERWGAWSLIVAKLLPGFGTVAVVLAGNLRVALPAFIALDILGAAVYAGIAIGLGIVFHGAVSDVIGVFEALGRIGGIVIVLGFAAFIAAKWCQRRRLINELRMARVSVAELKGLFDSGAEPTVIDVRSHASRLSDGSIPGAVHWSDNGDGSRPLPGLDRGVEVIVYCACPNEISAAKVARRLQQAGFRNVRPLHGGIEAWIDAGLPVEHPAPPGT